MIPIAHKRHQYVKKGVGQAAVDFYKQPLIPLFQFLPDGRLQKKKHSFKNTDCHLNRWKLA
jgi:hypothetical protein